MVLRASGMQLTARLVEEGLVHRILLPSRDGVPGYTSVHGIAVVVPHYLVEVARSCVLFWRSCRTVFWAQGNGPVRSNSRCADHPDQAFRESVRRSHGYMEDGGVCGRCSLRWCFAAHRSRGSELDRPCTFPWPARGPSTAQRLLHRRSEPSSRVPSLVGICRTQVLTRRVKRRRLYHRHARQVHPFGVTRETSKQSDRSGNFGKRAIGSERGHSISIGASMSETVCSFVYDTRLFALLRRSFGFVCKFSSSRKEMFSTPRPTHQ